MLDSKWRYPPFFHSLTWKLKYSTSLRLHSILGQTGRTTMTRQLPGSSSKTKTGEQNLMVTTLTLTPIRPPPSSSHFHSWLARYPSVSVIVVEGRKRNMRIYSHTIQLWSRRHSCCYGVGRVLVVNCIRHCFFQLMYRDGPWVKGCKEEVGCTHLSSTDRSS